MIKMSNVGEMLKKKTTWVGIIMIMTGLVQSWFANDEFQFDVSGLYCDRVLQGLAIIFGRAAIAKIEPLLNGK